MGKRGGMINRSEDSKFQDEQVIIEMPRGYTEPPRECFIKDVRTARDLAVHAEGGVASLERKKDFACVFARVCVSLSVTFS